MRLPQEQQQNAAERWCHCCFWLTKLVALVCEGSIWWESKLLRHNRNLVNPVSSGNTSSAQYALGKVPLFVHVVMLFSAMHVGPRFSILYLMTWSIVVHTRLFWAKHQPQEADSSCRDSTDVAHQEAFTCNTLPDYLFTPYISLVKLDCLFEPLAKTSRLHLCKT